MEVRIEREFLMLYFAEIDQDGKVVGLHESTGWELELFEYTGKMVQIAESTHAVLSSCSGDPDFGIRLLQRFKEKLALDK